MFWGQDYYSEGQEAVPATATEGSIFISGYDFAHNLNKLRVNKIFGICSAVDLSFKYPEEFKQIKFDLDDCETQDITNHFDSAFDFIEEQRKKTNVLVHCAAGISRSSAMLISYMMRKYDKSFDECLKQIRQKRGCCQPNSGFQKQLRKHQSELREKGRK